MASSYTTMTQVGGARFQWSSIPCPTPIPSTFHLIYSFNPREFDGVTLVALGSASTAEYNYILPAAALLDPYILTWLCNLVSLREVYQDYRMIPDSQKNEEWVYYQMHPELAGDVGWWVRGDTLKELISVVISLCGPNAGPRMHAAIMDKLLRICADDHAALLLKTARRTIIKDTVSFYTARHAYDVTSTANYQMIWKGLEQTWKPRCSAERWADLKASVLADIAQMAAAEGVTPGATAFVVNRTLFTFQGLTYENTPRDTFSVFDSIGNWDSVEISLRDLFTKLKDHKGKDPTKDDLEESGNEADENRSSVSWPPAGTKEEEFVVPFDPDEPVPGGDTGDTIVDGMGKGSTAESTVKADIKVLIPDVTLAEDLGSPAYFKSSYPPVQRFGRQELYAHMVWAWGAQVEGSALESFYVQVESGGYSPPISLDTATYEFLQSRFAIAFDNAYSAEEESTYVKFGWRAITPSERVVGTSYYRWEELGRTMIPEISPENILTDAAGNRGVKLTRRIQVCSSQYFKIFLPAGLIIYLDDDDNIKAVHGQSKYAFGSCLELEAPDGRKYVFDPRDHYTLLAQDAAEYKKEVEEFTDRSVIDPADQGNTEITGMSVQGWPWWVKWVMIGLIILLLLKDENKTQIINTPKEE